MASKVLDKLYSLLLLLLPELDMAVLAGCDNEVCPEKSMIYLIRKKAMNKRINEVKSMNVNFLVYIKT